MLFDLERVAKCEGDSFSTPHLTAEDIMLAMSKIGSLPDNHRPGASLSDQIHSMLSDVQKSAAAAAPRPGPDKATPAKAPTLHRPSNDATNLESRDAGDAVAKKCHNPSNAGVATPPRYMSDTDNPVYFLHIGKAGGTSVDLLFHQLLRGHKKRYIGNKHYDWSYIQKQQSGNQRNLRGTTEDDALGFDVSSNADVVTFIRNPVSRGVSQFYYSKKSSWMRNPRFAKVRGQTLEQYLDDPDKNWRMPITDGESGVEFLAGTFATDKVRDYDVYLPASAST